MEENNKQANEKAQNNSISESTEGKNEMYEENAVHRSKKSEWQEIENWNSVREANIKDEYGIDITKLGKSKKVDFLAKFLKVLVVTIWAIGKGAVIVAIILGLSWAIGKFCEAEVIMHLNP